MKFLELELTFLYKLSLGKKKKTKPKETKPKNCPETPHFHRTKHDFLPDLSFPSTTACYII